MGSVKNYRNSEMSRWRRVSHPSLSHSQKEARAAGSRVRNPLSAMEALARFTLKVTQSLNWFNCFTGETGFMGVSQSQGRTSESFTLRQGHASSVQSSAGLFQRLENDHSELDIKVRRGSYRFTSRFMSQPSTPKTRRMRSPLEVI